MDMTARRRSLTRTSFRPLMSTSCLSSTCLRKSSMLSASAGNSRSSGAPENVLTAPLCYGNVDVIDNDIPAAAPDDEGSYLGCGGLEVDGDVQERPKRRPAVRADSFAEYTA